MKTNRRNCKISSLIL